MLLLINVEVEHPVHAVEGDGQDRKDHGRVLVPVDLVTLGGLLLLPLRLVLGRGRGKGMGRGAGGVGEVGGGWDHGEADV